MKPSRQTSTTARGKLSAKRETQRRETRQKTSQRRGASGYSCCAHYEVHEPIEDDAVIQERGRANCCRTPTLHLKCSEGESLDTADGPTGFSAFVRPRAKMYSVCRTMCLRMHRLGVHYKVANGTTHTHTHTHTHTFWIDQN